ncbi:MAG: MBL fold metallo-hydrolase [Deltaproteobacteria bacterium]|nr:MBL fold metallo-hydrolase [Deltaproteobacteria bacterium]
MRFDKTGSVTDDLYVLGNSGNPVYLLDGPKPVLFDSGFTALAPWYEKDIRKILDGRSPAYLLITHSHFDHVGSAAYLKRLWPEMKIAASAETGQVLARPRALKLIRALNEKAGRMLTTWGVKQPFEGPFEPFELDQVLSSGQRLDVGGDLEIEAISTPGHTRDFMSYWVPGKRILVASEAAGCDDGAGRVWAEFLTD